MTGVRLAVAVLFIVVAVVALCGAVTMAVSKERAASRIASALFMAVASAGCLVAAASVMA